MDRVIWIVCLLMIASSLVSAKSARTFYDDATMAAVRAKIDRFDWAKAEVEAARQAAQWYLDKSDEELWDFVPPPQQIRAINVHHGFECPNCGNEAVAKAGHYPWKMDRDKPFKLECPNCGKIFPENDFQQWNTEGAEGEPERGERVIDNGLGWEDSEGRRFFIVPYYIWWQRLSKDVIGGCRTLANAYLLTGDVRYAHKCAILLTRVAEYWADYDYGSQGYHEGIWPAKMNGRMADYIWTTGHISTFTLAYDAIYPALSRDADADLVDFLASEGVDDPRQYIETNMVKVMANDILSGFSSGNMGMHQRTLCHVAIVYDNDDPEVGPTTAQMREWLMSGRGRVEDLLWNGFMREGMGGESAPGYSMGWGNGFYEVAELLPRIGVDIWSNPKLKKIADIGIDLAVAGDWTPCIGDAGSVMGAHRVGWSAWRLSRAFHHYADPRHAAALKLIGAKSNSLWDDYVDEDAIDAAVALHGTDIALPTRSLGGYGIGILEAGSGQSRRGLTMYYGDATGGHGHHDRLNMSFFSHGYPIFCDTGYPTPFRTPKRAGWNANTVSHFSVLIDEQPHQSMKRGVLNTIASTPGVQYMDASAEEATYPGVASLYRRSAALIDLSPDNSYVLDIFRARGGSQHDWSYHGPAHFSEFSVRGTQLGPVQTKGTLAGENVEFGDPIPERVSGGNLALELLEGDGLINEGFYGDTSWDGWAPFGKCILTRCPDADVAFDISELPAGTYKVFLHVYDYAKGENDITIAIGDADETINFTPSASTGYRWVSTIIDVAEPASEVTLTATNIGQTYIQIDSIVISEDLSGDEPKVISVARSGFNYLFNVRRADPAGDWSATWRKSDADIAMTTFVPNGCVQELIAADAVPELAPGNPDTMQYILGRNSVTAENAADPLMSTFIAVTEPHRGKGEITHVERLESDTQFDTTVGVAVHRGALTDIIHSSIEPGETCTYTINGQSLTVSAEFAAVTFDGAGVSRACIVNGTLLTYGDFALKPSPQMQGKIIAVDLDANTISVDSELAVPDACIDSVVFVGNEAITNNYTITSAEVTDGQTALGFGDVLSTIGMGCVTATDAEAGIITADRKFSGYGYFEGGRHVGRWIYNEDRSRGFRITAIDGGERFTLATDGDDIDEIFSDADGDGRRQFWISDAGVGDTWRIPTATWFER